MKELNRELILQLMPNKIKFNILGSYAAFKNLFTK